MIESTDQAQTVFLNALEISSDDVREAYVDAECRGDNTLRREVEGLLDHAQRLGDFLDNSVAPDADINNTIEAPAKAAICSHIGPYKIREQLAEGGMGVVYVADQTEPVRRRVALKVIKPGMASKDVVARFEAERQALAMMDHPNIARIFDGGATDSGQPFFAMELVQGLPITKYCDQYQLSPRERLQLFVKVCRAVQHAHQKGIIHRDIKPSNVMVASIDGNAVPKVIDFGVAKAVGQKLTDQTIYTQFAQMVGTPAYMSPEQVDLGTLDIDTRSDVYSLGVLLYELLTGNTPFDRDTLKRAGFDEFRRIIREDEPRRPSTVVSTLAAAEGSTISDQMKVDRHFLQKAIRGDLDAIVMKALEKDRTRRYETANGLARDLERHVNEEPVEARQPSTAYRLRKLLRRNTTTVVTVSLVALAVILGAAIAAGQAVRATKAEHLAKRQEQLAIQQRQLAQEAAQRERDLRTQADQQRTRAEANLRKAIGAVDQMLTRVGNQTLENVPGMEQVRRQVLEDALGFYQGFLEEKANDPAVRHGMANVRKHLADLYMLLGRKESASALYIEAARLLDELVKEKPSEPSYRDDLALVYRWLGVYGWEKVEYWRRAVEHAEPLVAQYPDNLSYRLNLAHCYCGLGTHLADPREGESFVRKAIALCEEGELDTMASALAASYHGLGAVLERRGKLDHSALDAYGNAARLHEELVTAAPANTALRHHLRIDLTDQGDLLRRCKRPAEAEDCYRRAFDLAKALANESPSVPRFRDGMSEALGPLIEILGETSRANEARQVIDDLDPQTVAEYDCRATLHQRAGRLKEALTDLDQAIRLASNPDLHMHLKRAELCVKLERHEQALADWSRCLEIDPSRRHVHKRRAFSHFHLGHFDLALADLVAAVETNPKDLSAIRWIPASDVAGCPSTKFREGMRQLADRVVELNDRSGESLIARAQLLLGLGDWGKARDDLDAALHIIQESLAAENRDVTKCPTTLARALNCLAWLLATCPSETIRDPQRAAELATKATELSPGESDYWNTLGVAQYRIGNYAGAVKSLNRSLKMSDAHVAHNGFFLALSYWQLGDKEEAGEWYDKSMQWMNDNDATDEELTRFRTETEGVLGIHTESTETAESRGQQEPNSDPSESDSPDKS